MVFLCKIHIDILYQIYIRMYLHFLCIGMNISRQYLDILYPVFKNKLISAMLFLALTSCVPDAKENTKAEKELDSIEMETKRLDQQLATMERNNKINDSITNVEKNKKVSDMHFPIFKESVLNSFKQTQIIEHNSLIPFDEFVEKLRNETHKWKKILLEWSPEAILFKDSLSLFEFFDNGNSNSLWQQVVATMDKNNFKENDSPLDSKQERELYDWFVRYLDQNLAWKTPDRDSDIRNAFVKKEKIGNITLYYTDLDKRMPWVIAKHPSIQPTDYAYIFRDFRPFDSADLYSLSYDHPKQSVITISSQIFSQYWIDGHKDIEKILDAVNNKQEIPVDLVPSEKKVAVLPICEQIPPIKQEELVVLPQPMKPIDLDIPLNKTQHQIIKTHWEKFFQMWDYWIIDGDKIKFEDKKYTLSRKPITVSLENMIWSKAIVEITSEWDTPPCTITLTIGSRKMVLKGKKWELIVLEFEE